MRFDRFPRRFILTLSMLLPIVAPAMGDEVVGAGTGISWQPAFEPISGSTSDDSLVLLMVTNDPSSTEVGSPSDDGGWCGEVFVDAFRDMCSRRPELQNKIRLQSCLAGLPIELTGGKPGNGTARSILFVGDNQYRLLSFVVGVPDSSELMTLIEDAQEYRSMREIGTLTDREIKVKLSRRSRERLTRNWREVLDENLIAMDVEEAMDSTTESVATVIERVSVLNERFRDVYLSDVRLRFGLNDASDAARLTTLEQHVQTCRPWCEAMTPFVAGLDLQKFWSPITESVWGIMPVRSAVDVAEVGQPLVGLDSDELLVLSIQPPNSQRHIPWPPHRDSTLPLIDVWHRVDTMARSGQYQEINLQQLALIMSLRNLPPIDIRGSSLIRYVALPPDKNKPLLVFQSDPPGRVVASLKRFQNRPPN